MEFDLHDLPNTKLKELHNYVVSCIQQQSNQNTNQGSGNNGQNMQTMDQVKNFMDTQQNYDANGMMQNQIEINNQLQQQIYQAQ